MYNYLNITKWAATGFAILGATFLALGIGNLLLIFTLYMIGSVLWAIVSFIIDEKALLLLNLVFTGINVIGILNNISL